MINNHNIQDFMLDEMLDRQERFRFDEEQIIKTLVYQTTNVVAINGLRRYKECNS